MTSNVGQRRSLNCRTRIPSGRAGKRWKRCGFVPAGFLNRIDEIVIFNPLGKEHLERIVGLLLKNVEKLLEDRQVTLELTPAAKELLLREGYDPRMGLGRCAELFSG